MSTVTTTGTPPATQEPATPVTPLATPAPVAEPAPSNDGPIVFNSRDEYNRAIERIRRQERNKLRSQLAKRSSEPAPVAGAPAASEPTNTSPNNTTSGSQMNDASVAEIARIAAESAIREREAEFDADREELAKERAELRAERDKLRLEGLETYRARKIREIEEAADRNPEVDRVVAELVRGNTPEEIDASIVASQKAYRRVVEAARRNPPPVNPANPAPTQHQPQPVPVPYAPAPQGEPGVGDLEARRAAFAAEVKGMSAREYASQRDVIEKRSMELGLRGKLATTRR